MNRRFRALLNYAFETAFAFFLIWLIWWRGWLREPIRRLGLHTVIQRNAVDIAITVLGLLVIAVVWFQSKRQK